MSWCSKTSQTQINFSVLKWNGLLFTYKERVRLSTEIGVNVQMRLFHHWITSAWQPCILQLHQHIAIPVAQEKYLVLLASAWLSLATCDCECLCPCYSCEDNYLFTKSHHEKPPSLWCKVHRQNHHLVLGIGCVMVMIRPGSGSVVMIMVFVSFQEANASQRNAPWRVVFMQERSYDTLLLLKR